MKQKLQYIALKIKTYLKHVCDIFVFVSLGSANVVYIFYYDINNYNGDDSLNVTTGDLFNLWYLS